MIRLQQGQIARGARFTDNRRITFSSLNITDVAENAVFALHEIVELARPYTADIAVEHLIIPIDRAFGFAA
jgi:hypothetical protein